MKQHYNIGDKEWIELSKSVTTMDLLKSISEFDPSGSEVGITKVSVLHYLDKHGDFNEGDEIHKKIASAVFSSLEPSDKVDVMKYMQWMEEGDD